MIEQMFRYQSTCYAESRGMACCNR